MGFDFKSFREDKLKLSQKEFADIYGIDLEVVDKLDKNIDDPRLPLLLAIAQRTGMTTDEIINYEKPKLKSFEIKDTWKITSCTKKNISEYIKILEKIDIPEEQRIKYIEDFKLGIAGNLIKPSISIVGRSDTGKSTLINSLIGQEKMPTSWTPTTSIAVYIKHIKDRPDFIKEDVWVFAREYDGELLWNAKRLDDEKYCKKWKIASGKVDILSKFGTRQGGGLSTKAGSAVVFLDAPILLNCDIVDLPGFGTETRSDDEITFKAAQRTDILIYLSQANGFMRIEDSTYLKQNVRNLPVWENKGENKLKPLSNLFVVASQAHTVNCGNPVELENILSSGCENFEKTLSKEYWNSRRAISGYTYSSQVVRDRFFTYTTDIPKLCERFLDELRLIVEQLPELIEQKTKKFIHEYVSSRMPGLVAEITKYEEIIAEKEKYKCLLKQIDSSRLQRAEDNNSQKKEVKDKINQLSVDTKKNFNEYCSLTINIDSITRQIKEKKLKNKKEDIECFASQLQDELQDKCTELLNEGSNELSSSIKKYINQYSANIQEISAKSDIDIDFDAGYEFASNLSKIGIIGGLGVYIAGEAAFLLGGIEFILGIGGDIALGAISLGPVGIAIGLVIAASLGFAKLFGGGWEKSIAKKIVKAYEENEVVEKYRSEIQTYWEKTEEAFELATEKLDKEWKDYVTDLEATVNEYDCEKINEKIVILKNIQEFFESVPQS